RILGVQESGLPVDWQHQDIGEPSLAGGVDYDVLSSAFAVQGAGKDIWETDDQLHFVYQALEGDGEIQAQVRSVEQTDNYAKAGVMIRGGLEANARHALMNLTPTQGAKFTWRSAVASAQIPVHGTSNGIKAPYWVKLVRMGNHLAGYSSADGQEWELIGETNVQLPATAFVGLAVTSHNVERVCRAEFTDVKIIRSDRQTERIRKS
ncbi:MAG: hypothetical protein NTW86_22795, partial [Candidatus Sumerlaeota bacterium]|nr:hypothetical protein [Candidatus Sumerlaeota bacterium]